MEYVVDAAHEFRRDNYGILVTAFLDDRYFDAVVQKTHVFPFDRTGFADAEGGVEQEFDKAGGAGAGFGGEQAQVGDGYGFGLRRSSAVGYELFEEFVDDEFDFKVEVVGETDALFRGFLYAVGERRERLGQSTPSRSISGRVAKRTRFMSGPVPVRGPAGHASGVGFSAGVDIGCWLFWKIGLGFIWSRSRGCRCRILRRG